MEENLEHAASLDNRAVAAKQSESETERLIEDFKPFLNARAARYAPQSDWAQREELQSVTMMAFYEAIQKYDINKGHFFPFADRVVRARIIDSIRLVYKAGEKTVSFEADNDAEPSSNSSVIDEISIRSYDEQRRREMITEEIEQFKAELALWGITMDALSRQSPKHRKLLLSYRMAIAKILQNSDIVQTIQLKRYFPIKAVALLTGLPQKNVERARTFILASLIIKLGDFDYLSEYISEGGDSA